MSIRFLIGLAIGLVVGAAVGLAIAPQGGEETRKQLWDRAGSHGASA